MRESLSSILRSHHRRLYVRHLDTQPWPFRLFGFQTHDGWFGLIDALSAVVASRVVERDLRFSIIQVKEKFGTLRYYADGMDDFCRGAKWFAEAMSGRLSERSGHTGLPSRINHYMCTLAPGEDPAAEINPGLEPTERFVASCGPANALALVQAAWPMTHIDVPAGLADLADVLVGFLTASETTGPPPSAIVICLGRGNERRLTVDMSDLDDWHLGGIAVAARLASVWIDPLTGNTGSVDDLGRPVWAAA
ncbi:MAG: hypothetical protein ABSC06_07130 [Rhodopila sp.]